MFVSSLIIFLALQSIDCDERGNRVKRIVGGEPAGAPPEDDPVVYTRFNGRTARVQGIREFSHYAFRGVPYAHAPIGKDRFLVRKKLNLDFNNE